MKDIQYNRYVCELLAIREKICLLFFGEEKGLVWGVIYVFFMQI